MTSLSDLRTATKPAWWGQAEIGKCLRENASLVSTGVPRARVEECETPLERVPGSLRPISDSKLAIDVGDVELHGLVAAVAALGDQLGEVGVNLPDGGADLLRRMGGLGDEDARPFPDLAAVGFRHPILIFRPPWDLETIGALGTLQEALASLV